MMYSVNAMAEELDVSAYVINKYIKRFKLKGTFIQTKKNINILHYPQTAFDIIKDSVEGTKVVEKNYYTTNQVAELAGVSASCICNIANRNKILKIVRVTDKSRVAYYPKESLDKILEIIETRRDKRLKAAHEKARTVAEETAEQEALHPLVTDKRWLKLNEWPDVVPDCFKELDE